MTTAPATLTDARTSAASANEQDTRVFRRGNMLLAGALYLAAFVTLLTIQKLSGIPILGVSKAPHFVYQAESFLQGRWDITQVGYLWDTIHLHGKLYAVFPPFPALIMLPFVAVFGIQTSDIFITAVIAALNLPLLYLLLEQARANGLSSRTLRENLIISLMLYFGSINLYLSVGGEVWFTAQVIGLTCTLLALLLALRRSFGWSAALMGCAFLSRGSLALGLPLIVYLAWQNGGSEAALQGFARSVWRRAPDWRAIPWRRIVPPIAVFLGFVVVYLLRNALTFGSPLESGYGLINQQHYSQMTHGIYSLAYVPRNLVAMFFEFPRVAFATPFALQADINLIGDGQGMSVFITTPLFLLLYAKNRRTNALRIALHITVALCTLQALLYFWTGYFQFGDRYLFDAYPYAFLLLALNDRRVDWRFIVLGLLGVALNTVGAREFWSAIG